MAAAVVAACGRGGDDLAIDQRSARTTSTASTIPAETTTAPTTTAPTTAPAPATTRRASPATTRRPTTQPPAPPAPSGPVNVRLTQVAALDQPVAMAFRVGDPAMYVAEKGGRVRALRGGVDTVLDVAGQVSTGGEQGLLGLTFSPDGARMYIDYTDVAGDTQIVEYAMAGGRADTATRRVLLSVDQPYSNHNGGQILFGPDGFLYIALGDGGSGGDPENRAQNLGELLGKILRIDPRGGSPYGIPPGNPFAGRPGARAEIWSWGLRNPWRFTFDRATGDMWIGDVGQNAWEEVDFEPRATPGRNYGWDRLEGNHVREGSPPPGHILPVHEYSLQGTACAVTGGYTYRGSAVPNMVGAYVFADFCVGQLWMLRNGQRTDLAPKTDAVSSFGEDPAGELYVLSLNGPVFRIDRA